MTEWIQKANDLIISALGTGHSSVERIIIAFCGILAFFLILKLFTKGDGGGNAAWIRRFIASVLIFVSVLLGAVVADMFVNPYVSNDILQKVILVVLPVIIIMIIATPLLMLLLRKDYGSALVTAGVSIIAGLIVVFAISFIIDSFTGSDKEFKNLKKRTHDIDEFINN